MNVEKLKKIVAADATISDRSVIISVEYGRGLRSRANMAADIMSVFGKANVECLDFITQKLILVTLGTTDCCPGDNLRMIQYRPPNSNPNHALYYNVHLITPVKAKVEGVLTGIPHFYSSRQLDELKEKIIEKLPTLTEVSMDYVPWPGTSIMCGDLSVKGITTDIDTSYTDLVKASFISVGEFEGQVSFKVTGLVDKTEKANLPVDERTGISLHNWYDD